MRLETSKTHRCMLVIGSCVVDRTRVAAPGTIWLTGPALCSLVEHRLRGSKRDPKKQSFSVGPSWFPGTSHPSSSCRAQRARSSGTCACKMTGDALLRRLCKGEPRSRGIRLTSFQRTRQERPDAPCSHSASPFIAPRPRHAHRFAGLFLSHARTTVNRISAQSRVSR